MDPEIATMESESIKALKEDGFTVQKVVIIKSGVRYSATLIYHETTQYNNRWIIDALGRNGLMEKCLKEIGRGNFWAHRCNSLVINGPSLGSSKGFPTRYQLGAA